MIGTKKVYAILAIDGNNGIGYQNKILFKNTMDMYIFKYFTKQIYSCVVGKTTFKDLPKIIQKTRKIYVLSKTETFDDVITIKNITDIEKIETDSIVVIGGAKIYESFAPFIDMWLITTFKSKADLVDTYLSDTVINTYSNKLKITIYEDEEIQVNLFC